MAALESHFPVLILDDDETTLALERRILERAGFSVLSASTAAAARQAVLSGRVALLVLDYRLGHATSGLDFFRALRAEGRNLPAILVTSFSDESKVIEALRAGIRDVVPKAGDYLEYLPLAVRRIIEQVQTERQVAESEALKDLVERLRQESQTLETINRLGRRLAGELDLDRLVQTAVEAGTELAAAEAGALFYSADDTGGEPVVLSAFAGANPRPLEQAPLPRTRRELKLAFADDAVLRTDDAGRDPRFAGMLRTRADERLALRSLLGVPIVSRAGQAVGVMFFAHTEPGMFGARATQLAQGVASQAAVSIDNASLVEALRSSEESLRRNAQERERLLESERAARAESERASRLKDEFLATLSHELRTPLNAILGWTHLLRARPADAQQVAEGLETIDRNARAQTQIVNDLLEMSRIVSGKLRLDVQRVDLASVIDAAIGTIKPAADAKGIRFRAAIAAPGGAVTGDPARLQQVLWNLLSNAIKFTPAGGEVDVRVERTGSQMAVTIVDTGQGIRPDFLPYIFDRFRQADASTTRLHRGMGLGLAIVKNLVEMHGGSVIATSAGEGRGSTFVVTLPAAPADAGAERAPAAIAASVAADLVPQLTGLRLLVVDDEPDAREFLARVLAECGADVRTASSSEEAIRSIDQRTPDVLICDIGMPVSDGYDLIRAVRDRPAAHGGKVPALALTAFARSEDRQRALLAGYQAHLAKPAEPTELITQIASLAGRLWPLRALADGPDPP
jgi:signal transduction histidine kinase/DNA-binding response OmpR family regulator